MRSLSLIFILAIVLAPLPLRADNSGAEIPVADPEAKVQSVKSKCERRYANQPLGSLAPSTFCEVYAWSELGKSYPALLKVARQLERKYNHRAGKVESLRSQLRRERQQTDKLSMKLGKQSAKLNRLEGRWPQWATWALSAGALIVGGAAEYGIGVLLR